MKQSHRRKKQLKSSGKLYNRLDPHQKAAVDFAAERVSSALFYEPRTGKTFITGGLVERLSSPAFLGLLIVPLNNKQTTWIDKFTAWFGEEFVYTDWSQFKKATGRRVLILHYEEVPSLVAKLRRLKWSLIVYDESQRLKARGTLQSRTAHKLRYSAEKKVILSGTPMDKYPTDMWSQFKFLAPEVLGERWKDFEKEFIEPFPQDVAEKLRKLRPGSNEYLMVLRQGLARVGKRRFDMTKLPQFLERIASYTIQAKKEDVNIRPPRIHLEWVRLRGEQRRIYEALEDDLFSSIGGFRVTAPLKVTQLVKLHQVCGGSLIDDEGRVQEVGRAKLRRLMRLLLRIPRPVVIFCKYRAEVDAIRELSQGETFTGATKKRLRPEIQRRFQAGLIDVLVVQQRTGGVGVDFFRSKQAIFFSTTYSFLDFEQALSRIQNRNQHDVGDIYLIVARGTVDEDIFEAILSKRQVTEMVLDGLRRRRHG